MSWRFLVGAWSAAALNLGVGSRIGMRHELMATQPSWKYMFEFAPWSVWTAAFAASGLVAILGLLLRRDLVIRGGIALGVTFYVALAASLTLYPFDPSSGEITGLIPLLSVGPAILEFVFIAIPGFDWFDDIDRRAIRRREVQTPKDA